MRDVYKIEVKKNKLINALDMLRYDGAYRVEGYGEEYMTIWSMFYTPKRWKSFNVRADLLEVVKITNKEFNNLEKINKKDVEGKLKDII